MLTPRYFFIQDFRPLEDYFLANPHVRRQFAKGDYLWEPGEPFRRIHYILSGLSQNYVEHENARRKILSFHGCVTVFPGYHQQDFQIERSILTRALSPMEVLEFTKDQFRRMFEQNGELRARVVEWFATYTNLLLYDTAHQEYNSSFIKLCNLLYLLLVHRTGMGAASMEITQDDLSDLLGMSRVNLTRSLARLREEGIIQTRRKGIAVMRPDALARYCSLETVGLPPEESIPQKGTGSL